MNTDDPIATYREHVARALSLCGGGGPDDEDDDTQPGPAGPDEQDEEQIR